MRNTRASYASFDAAVSESEAKFEHRLRGDWQTVALLTL
jgi:hypothetical protein